MKLWRRIKLRMLEWLLADICKRQNCRTCMFSHGDDTAPGCDIFDVVIQAREAYEIGK